jgi:NitT/TauT family transport system substrate-binding protein
LRAQWKVRAWSSTGRNFSKLPANTVVMRRADFADASKKDLYAKYLRGWAMGLESGYLNQRAAKQVTPPLGRRVDDATC